MSGSPKSHWRRVLLGVSGGIAAYKAVELARGLVRDGVEVQVVMTRAATEFVTPLTFETLTGRPVYHEVFNRGAWEIEHIAYARWGEVLVIAPATANTLARMALGMADDALTTTCLAFDGPVLAAPAMNTVMWNQPATQENLRRLEARGVRLVAPASGELACGEQGAGKLAPVEEIRLALEALRPAGALSGKRVLITAGPTVERIDPVRYLSNASSGRMGFALAREAKRRGATVTLVAGPTALEPPENVDTLLRIESAAEMHRAVLEQLEAQDACVFCAAVADYTPSTPSATKLKKEKGGGAGLSLELKRTPDIAAAANEARRPGQKFIGFAAETDAVEENAADKLRRKGFDVVVANEVSASNPAFAARENRVTLLAASGARRQTERVAKEDLAGEIWDFALESFDWNAS